MSSGRSTGSTSTATATATGSSSTRAARRPGSSSRDGRTRRIPCFTPTARSPSRRSRCAKCRPTSTTRAAAPRALADALGDGARATRAAATARSGCGGAFEDRFWCDDRRNLRARARRTQAALRACGARTPATACSAASRRRNARGASPSSWSARRCFRAGASGPSRRRSRDTTRCRITTVRSGRTTTASSRPVSRDTDSTI